MQIEFSKLFLKNIEKLPQQVTKKFRSFYEALLSAKTLNDFSNIKKLRGYNNLYRFRMGDYRVTFEMHGAKITFNNIAHRKDIYQDL